MAATARGRAIEGYREAMDEIHGALRLENSYVWEAIDASQRSRGIEGDILEIGVYQGKTAILLGYLLSPGERLHLCDKFVEPSEADPDFLAGTLDYYEDYPVSVVTRNYLRFHDELPDIHVGSSLGLPGMFEPKSFRLIHLDGSHDREVLRSDVALARSLLVDGGVISFVGYRLMHTLEVAHAAWKEITDGSLRPICATDLELFVTNAEDPSGLIDDLTAATRGVPSLQVTTPPFGDAAVPIVTRAAGGGRLNSARRYIPPVMIPALVDLRRRYRRLAERARTP